MKRSKGKRLLDSTPLAGVIGESLLPPLPAVKRPCIGSLTSEAAAIVSAISEGRCCCHEIPKFLRKLADRMEESKEMRFLFSEESAQPWEKSPCPARLGSAAKGEWSHPKVTEAADTSHLELRILNPLSLPIFTDDEVTGKNGEEISVALFDANVNVKSFREVKLNVVVLHGDFNSGNDRTWSKEEFDGHIVKKRDNKALLAGHRQVTLKGGCAKLVGLKFADNSSFVRTKEFRLGVQVAPSDCEGLRILEAITDPFRVLDRRVKRNGKHYDPQFNDKIWRLRSIGKNGDPCRNLNAKGVETVEDFLRLLVINEQELRRLLSVGNGGMKNNQWKDLINHAKTCIPSGKRYFVPSDIAGVNRVIVLNSFYELSELIVGSQHCSADSLTDDEKARARALVKEAYEKKMIMEDDDNHASLAQYNNGNGFQTEGLPGERLPACEGFVTMVQPTMLPAQNFANNGTSQCSERFSIEGCSTYDHLWDYPESTTYQNSPPDTATVQPTMLPAQNFANNGTSQCSERFSIEGCSTYDHLWDYPESTTYQNSTPDTATVQPNINNDVRCIIKVVCHLFTIRRKLLKRRESLWV